MDSITFWIPVFTGMTYSVEIQRSRIVIRGAKPVFADVDLDSGNISAESINAVLTPKTKAIICVHLAGWPCDMDPIMDLAKKRGLSVIEDCAQAHGAGIRKFKVQSSKFKASSNYEAKLKKDKDQASGEEVDSIRPVGSFGHVACFSFCQDKILTTGGEGGMLITNDEAVFKKAWSYKDHGKSYDAVYNKEHSSGPVLQRGCWLHESIGTNLRLTEIQSAIGRVVLKKLTHWVKLRRRNAEILEGGAKNILP